MSRRVVRWPGVDHDLAGHFAFIYRDKAEPAERLLVVAEESFQRIGRHPDIGLPWKSRRPHLAGILYYPMPAPYRSYVIFYRAFPDRVEIITVLHGARDLEKALRKKLG